MFFFLFIHYDHFAMIKIKKFFFQLAGTIITPRPREKKVFFIQPLFPLMKKEKCCFSFFHYDHYAMTKSESFFLIQLLRTLPYDQERKKFLFSFTYYDQYAMFKREKSFFHLATLSTNEERKMFCFIQLPRSVRHDRERKKFLSFSHYVH